MSIETRARERARRIRQRAEAKEESRARRREQFLEPPESPPEPGLAGPLTGGAPETESRVLLAEGDSWFDYPGTDLLEELEDVHGYRVESVAHRGDTLESMAYGPRQQDGFDRRLRKIADRDERPRAVLLSGGGNDIAGDELAFLLNHAASGEPALHDMIVAGMMDRLRSAYEMLIRTIGLLGDDHFGPPMVPVLVHGYSYPVPDGRGYLGGWGPLPGPWLEPSFERRGWGDLEANTKVMEELIDRFNAMLLDLTGSAGFEHVTYVNLRPLLSNELANRAYRDSWDNELHPEDSGFQEIADRLDEVLRGL